MYLSYAHMPTYSVLSLFACCSVMFGGVVFFRWSLLHSHRTVVGPAFKGPSLILSLCSWFNMDRPGQSRRKPPLPPLCSLCSALYLTSLSLPSPHHNQSRTGSWITIIVLEHSATLQKRQEKRRVVIPNPCWGKWSQLFPSKLSVQFVSYTEWCLALFFHTERIIPYLSSTPQSLLSHLTESFFKEPK